MSHRPAWDDAAPALAAGPWTQIPLLPSQPPLLPPLTVVVAAKRLVLGGVGVEVAELPQVPNAVAKGSDGQVLGGEGLDVLHLAGAWG